MNNNFENSLNQEEESIDIKKEISYYLFFWPWFLLTIVFALDRFLYLFALYTQIYTQVLLKYKSLNQMLQVLF